MEPQTNPQALMYSKCRLFLVPAFVAGIFVGFYVPFLRDGGSQYQAGFDAAKNRILESPAGGALRTPDDIRTLSGIVTAVSGNRITIQTQSIDPFADSELAERTIIVTSNTQIIRISQGDAEAFNAEMEAFMRSLEKGVRDVQPPAPLEPTRTVVEASSILVGDTLTVTASENIKSKKEISASEIQVQ
ncbi:MAG: hypothetical protein A2481_04560 [Candidatus Yonathbacteria bacterium RIFOXYC2_FULL_47_9]|nr:MAG: hypothetical protein A2481_04560 [Candidatus Yonathbacteria bacterium RIFOXYC2_FULL_47_9]HAT68657.1 hypothetical protein [Candidatus Yonathbacteria bacterium]